MQPGRPATLTQPFECDLQPQIQETQRTTHTDTTTRCRTQRRNQSRPDADAPATHMRYLSSPAATTLHGKIQGFVLRLPPQNKAQATSMQPLQYVSQHPVANLHLSTHTRQHQMTTIMHPFQCGLQPQIQEAHRTTNTDTTTRCRTQRRNQSRPERPQPHLPHTRGTFFAGCNHFTRKNTRFRAPASSPKQSPGNIHAAITIRFAASRSKPASLYTHTATPDDNNHAPIPMRSATTDSRSA